MKRVSDEMIRQAEAILPQFHEGEFVHAMAAVEKAWGRFVGKSTLCDVFRRAGLPQPSTYLQPRRTAADRLAASGARDVQAARHVGDPGGVSDRRPARTRVDDSAQEYSGMHNADGHNRPVDNRTVAQNATVAHGGLDQKGQLEPRVKQNRWVAGNPPVWNREEPRKPKPLAGTGAEDLGKNPLTDPSMHIPTAPKSYRLRGVSTLVDAAGNPVMQWIKTAKEPDGNRLEALLEELRKLPAGYSDIHEPKPAPTHLDADLLCLIPLGDPHLGLRVWSEEAGNDYDINIAEHAHVDAIRKLISVVPSAKQALIVSLGDLLHCDNNSARTTRSGNQLDVDTRWQKVMRVGLRMLRAMIDLSLAKFETVRVVCEQGNHDDLSSIMMAMMLEAFYSKDPRVSVDTSPSPFHYYRFGKNLIGTTHGAETKPEQLPMIMAADRPEDWGATEHRRWLCGHVHHESVREFPGVTAEWFRTLAPRDAWANAKGYRAGRDMRCDVLHREHGFVSRYAIGINQLDVA